VSARPEREVAGAHRGRQRVKGGVGKTTSSFYLLAAASRGHNPVEAYEEVLRKAMRAALR